MKQFEFSPERLPSLVAEMEAILADLDALGVHLAGVHIARALEVLRARLEDNSGAMD